MDFNKPLDKSNAIWLKSGVLLVCFIYMFYSFFINKIRPDLYDAGRWIPVSVNLLFILLCYKFPNSIFHKKYPLFAALGLGCLIFHYAYLLTVNNHEMNYSASYVLLCTICILILSHYYQVIIVGIISYGISLYISHHVNWMAQSVYDLWVVSTIIISAFSTCVKINLINKKNKALNREKNMREKLFSSSRFTVLGELSSGLGHEINNPLMIISNYLQILDIDEEKDEETKKVIGKIQTQVMRIGNVTKSLKEFVDTEKSVKFDFYLKNTIEKSLTLLDSRIKHSKIKIILPEKDQKVFGKEPEVCQILVNLLSNAIDALEGRANKQIKITIKEDGENVFLSVWDNGVGIIKENQGKIFTPFFTTKDPNKGTGIGLSVSKQLALKNDYDLYLDEKITDGTNFTLSIPPKEN